MKKLVIVLSMLMSGAIYAGCNPCVCGPGGGYEGNLAEWWLLNCGRLPKTKSVLCYNKSEDKIQKILDLDVAINSEELTACSTLSHVEK